MAIYIGYGSQKVRSTLFWRGLHFFTCQERNARLLRFGRLVSGLQARAARDFSKDFDSLAPEKTQNFARPPGPPSVEGKDRVRGSLSIGIYIGYGSLSSLSIGKRYAIFSPILSHGDRDDDPMSTR